jgi:hypothetical protein
MGGVGRRCEVEAVGCGEEETRAKKVGGGMKTMHSG